MTGLDANRQSERTVLHVLPHPGGGGETPYVDSLSRIEGYRAERRYLSSELKPGRAIVPVVRNALGTYRPARAYTLLHVHGEVASAACLPSLALRPSVVTMNGLHLLRRLDGVKRAAARANLRLIVEASSRTICVSEAEHVDVVGAVGARAASKTVMIRNGIEPLPAPSPEDRAAVRAELGIADETVVGVFVGSLDEHKDPLTPVRAVVSLAQAGVDTGLIVAGDGPLRPELEQVAQDAGDGIVYLTGFRHDVPRVLAAADFFTLPSWREGLSFALLEAMSLGLPAVVSDAPGNPEAVGDVGIVVPIGDVAGFASAFRRIVGDEHERHTLGAQARERVTRQFHVDGMLHQTRQVYDEVVEDSGRR